MKGMLLFATICLLAPMVGSSSFSQLEIPSSDANPNTPQEALSSNVYGDLAKPREEPGIGGWSQDVGDNELLMLKKKVSTAQKTLDAANTAEVEAQKNLLGLKDPAQQKKACENCLAKMQVSREACAAHEEAVKKLKEVIMKRIEEAEVIMKRLEEAKAKTTQLALQSTVGQ